MCCVQPSKLEVPSGRLENLDLRESPFSEEALLRVKTQRPKGCRKHEVLLAWSWKASLILYKPRSETIHHRALFEITLQLQIWLCFEEGVHPYEEVEVVNGKKGICQGNSVDGASRLVPLGAVRVL